MSLAGASKRFLYSGATNSNSTQSDPALSLGGFRPDNANPAASEPYAVGTFDALSTVPYIVEDTQTDTPASSDAAPGDWIVTVSGACAPSYARVDSVDYVSHLITLDRGLRALAASGNAFRVCKRENLFPDATADEVKLGTVDHRMIYLLKTNTGTENNFRFWIDPIIPNGCDIEILPSGTFIADSGGTVTADSEISTPTESPFTELGRVATGSADWNRAGKPKFAYSEGGAMTPNGSANSSDEGAVPIWIRRTIPPGAPPGECVFLLNAWVPDATTQDAGADPDPFRSGFIFSWNNPEPTYTLRILADRPLHTGGTIRIIGEVTFDDGTPLVGLNARLSKVSGGGSLAADPDAMLDARGRVEAIYTAPASTGSNPTFRLELPTSVRV